MLILDTHVLVWLCEGNARLGKMALKMINQALGQEKLAVATISFWEMAMLVEKGRLEMAIDPEVLRQELLADGLREIPLSGSTAIRAAQLESFHGDPADRMIAATALEQQAMLVTADKKLLSWGGFTDIMDASR